MSGADTTGVRWRYGLLGLPLAFVSLPLYVLLPTHYAAHHQVPLATLGALLLITRLVDASMEPAIGRWVDRLFAQHPKRSWHVAAMASVLMAGGFTALWFPPTTIHTDATALLAWLSCGLIVTYLAYSVVSMVHQTWGARWGGPARQRAALIAWREGAMLAGVLLASVLPAWQGWLATSTALSLSLMLGLWTLYLTLPSSGQAPAAIASASPHIPRSSTGSPWHCPPFTALLQVFLLNGTASAIPATVLPLFVRDTLQAPSWEPLFLGSYFAAAAIGLPLWLGLIQRHGLAQSWLIGMGLSVLSFCATPLLGAGDVLPFELICLLSGLALGADLAIPGALLTGVIHHAGVGQRDEGRFFGWWTAATKLNLALAAGLALPLLALAGFDTQGQAPDNRMALALVYGLLPCLFKLLAAGWLWRAMRHHPVLKGHA